MASSLAIDIFLYQTIPIRVGVDDGANLPDNNAQPGLPDGQSLYNSSHFRPNMVIFDGVRFMLIKDTAQVSVQDKICAFSLCL